MRKIGVFLDWFLILPRAAVVLMLACIWALMTALIAQYGFDQQPCVLCVWQRIPFALTIILTGIVLWAHESSVLARRVLLLAAVVLLADAVLSFFHMGVEQHWWAGTSGCEVLPLSAEGATLREQLLSTQIAQCDRVSWTFLGISITMWNVPFTLGLTAFAVLASHVAATGRGVFSGKKKTCAKPAEK
jgi:disulfide bond formation protein DsbB